MAERDVASTAARNRGHETPGAAAGMKRPAAWSLRTGAGGNAGDGSGPWADNATVEQIPHLSGALWSFVDSCNPLGYRNFLYSSPW